MFLYIPQTILINAIIGKTKPLEVFLTLKMKGYKESLIYIYELNTTLPNCHSGCEWKPCTPLKKTPKTINNLYEWEDWIVPEKIVIDKQLINSLKIWKQIKIHQRQ